MSDLLCDRFQQIVAQYTLRHKSILDILSKIQEAQARVQRAVAKAVTNCGCIQVQAAKQNLPAGVGMAELPSYLTSHLLGELCPDCRETVEEELGQLFFYLTALCNTLDISLTDVLDKEQDKLCTLRYFSLT
ncbi:MAG: DUF1573 domain-containing protein [Thermoanaerobacteraceae bacterium]|uniref:DUF1573 domain-containing protein n=1 Tax=Thermanaeromonas sp. C210 TaxID=2731925 RepID=UPI00155B862E|nr:DUF1573 domain-containing protein [Thermanaeromonas sp. C210]MBE3580372.1 DUF1573 domain-containing protein [Thermoanaerobacteraceae bacterium]GFN23130.1 hypothetical protein TAMC210_14470 [Thermanaeromonas sp. C210]